MIIIIATIAVLIMSVVVHEVAHGLAAYAQGDDTAYLAGRLTLNPIKHLDPVGSVLVPIILAISQSPFFFAWAKPVPFNPYKLRDAKYGGLKVAIAGPLANFTLAIIFAIISRLLLLTGDYQGIIVNYFNGNQDVAVAAVSGSILASLYLLACLFVLINLVLGLFNLLPLPPLDGSRIIFPFLNKKGQELMLKLEYSPWAMLIVIVLAYSGMLSTILTPVIIHSLTWLLGL